MAFAVKSLRSLSKVYNGNCRTAYSIFRQSVARTSLVQNVQKYCYTTEAPNRPKITQSLTNIQSLEKSAQSLAQELLEKKRLEEEQQEEEEQKKHHERTKRLTKYSLIAFGTMTSLGLCYIIYELGKPTYDEHGNIIEDEFYHLPYYEKIYKRLRRELNYYKKFIQEPSRAKLLPDPFKYPYIQPPYTLVLEVKDLLLCPDWTYETGWRFKKRPYVDEFLEAVAPPQFEVVIYTAEPAAVLFPILDSLDPNGYIMYRLFRDATRFTDGHHVKDLAALNRDLSKVIVVDWNNESIKYYPENTLKLERWTGDDNDKTLYHLAAFLKTISLTNVEDVREVLNYYRQFDDPLKAFRDNQRKLLEQLEEENKTQKENSKHLTSRWTPSFLRNR
ncbi:mitochondrial import inner membrane translocase subunit TIM50-C-like isoform X1 [Vespa crabro]|uniref:mitochondrial import inner membrane translocase subunit TIM50-C-like isoform X1 n=1 Tax=Vespa crabro TaxID=7445 RepID=UPI001F001697|nr:mitochondrial import inner membrane translocase subunit TIM50-C-like isoform X1 [Vespa crabro]